MQENLKEALEELLRRERVLDQLKQFTDNTGHLTSKTEMTFYGHHRIQGVGLL